MKLKVYKSKDELNEALAELIRDLIKSTLNNQEYFTLALSGGETPTMLYKKLASPDYLEKINWKRVHIFWGDERAVPLSDDRNNAKMAYKKLLDYANIPEAQIHKMRVDIMPLFASKEYENILHTYFDNREFSFDLILLGVGEDGHTLSLYPGSDISEESHTWVSPAYNIKQQMYRITLMPNIVNRARNIIFLATGESKAAIVHRIIEGDYNPEAFPAQIIQPRKGELYWFLDQAAAGKLTR